MLTDKIKEMIREKFNSPLVYPQQCEALSMAIKEATGHSLGTTTLKRLMGFIQGSDSPRRSSLDIIARYLGYQNYSLLAMDLGDDTDISGFREVGSIDSADLEIGEKIQVTYRPNRVITLRYLGDNKFEIEESIGSKLQKGDKLMIAGFYVGFELLISDVERCGKHLGSYQAAKQGGLTGIEIIG